MRPEESLRRAGHTLPASRPPVANYVMSVLTGHLLVVSGHGTFDDDGTPLHLGKLGAGLGVTEGRRAAEAVMLNLIATVQAELGDLSRISRWVKLLVLVNATPDFAEHHLVANGATDLLVTAFGADIGRPARSALGVASLPLGFAVEIEAIVEVGG
jgi:enamine deaminase RidA (YjgF/YER057c/UK114 family)